MVPLPGKVSPTGAILYQQDALGLQALQVQHGGRGFLWREHGGKRLGSVVARCVVYDIYRLKSTGLNQAAFKDYE